MIRKTRESLKKLRTEYVDLLLMHWPGDGVPLGETLGAMRELQEEGSVLHVGVSNFSPSLVEEAAEHAQIFCNQVQYHPYRSQDALLEQAQEMDYLLTAYTPLSRGGVQRDKTLREIGEAHNKTATQVALRWLLQQDKVCAIPKATGEEHLRRTSTSSTSSSPTRRWIVSSPGPLRSRARRRAARPTAELLLGALEEVHTPGT